MADLDIVPPAMPGGHPAPERKKEGFFSKLFGHGQEPSTPAPTPDFTDVDIEEIKRKLGLHEDQAPTRMPDPESFLPPPPDASKDERIAPRHAEPVPTPSAQEPMRIEEEQPLPRVEIADWTADGANATPSDSTVATRRVAAKRTATKKEPVVPAVEPRSEWSAPAHEADTPAAPVTTAWTAEEPESASAPAPADEAMPHHHAAVEQHLTAIDKASEKLTARANSIAQAAVAQVATAQGVADSAELPEWKLQDKELHPTQYFILRNGQPLKSLKELLEVITYIDDSTFDHHVNEYRNDFAQWIEGAIGDADLAQEVRSATDRAGVMTALRAHAQDRAQMAQAKERKALVSVRKTEQAITKLKDAGSEVDRLRAELETRTRELLGERKRAARIVKGALDKEIDHRLTHEREAMQRAIEQLERGKQLYASKAKELQQRLDEIGKREQQNEAIGARLKEAELRVSATRKEVATEKAELVKLKSEAAQIRKEYLETRARQEGLAADLKEIDRRTAELARHEEALRQREAKVTADITRAHEERVALEQLKAEHLPREEELKRKEDAARKLVADAQARAKEAVERERDSIARVRAETQKLERVRTQIDRALSKILKSKKKISTAIELRKHLEASLLGAKSAVSTERKELEGAGYQALVESSVAQTPAGQPPSDADEDLGRIRDAEFTLKITQARAALERKDLAAARQCYEDLRQSYAQVKEDAPERSALYIAIRELYDDIHLAMLG